MEKGSKLQHAGYQKKYVEKNPLMAKLSQTRKKVAITERRRSDPLFDAAFKKKAAEQKRAQRLRKKSGMRENELLPQGELNMME